MVAWKLYYSSKYSKREFRPKGENSDDTYEVVNNICPLTFQIFKSRKKFWDHIKKLKLDPKNI